MIYIILASLMVLGAESSVDSLDAIYGDDNRQETISASPFYQELADSAAAMVEKKYIFPSGVNASIRGSSFGKKYSLCSDQRFIAQPSAAYCSGFLVAPNVMATAGHCVETMADCEKASWVFNYKVKNENDVAFNVSKEDVYECAGIIKQEYGTRSHNDFALIKLDRMVKGHTPVRLAKVEPNVGEPLVLIGHPSGLPQKVADGGAVLKKTPTGFDANLDAFHINSGSAVFHGRTGELVGILVSGSEDYRLRPGKSCYQVNILSNGQGGEGVSSFKQFAKFIPTK